MSSCAYTEKEYKNVALSTMYGLPPLRLQHFSFALDCNDYNLWTEGSELESFWEQIQKSTREVVQTSSVRRWIDSTELACSQYFCLPILEKDGEGLIDSALDFFDVTDKILLNIFEHLTMPDLMRYTRVCKKWKKLIQGGALEHRKIFSRQNLLPSFNDSNSHRWTSDQFNPLVAYCRPYIPQKMMKILFKKLAPKLTTVVLDMLRNFCNCSNCLACSHLGMVDTMCNKYLGRPYDILQFELYMEKYCIGGVEVFCLDHEDQTVVALAEAVGDRLESLVIGSDINPNMSISKCFPMFFAQFKKLKELVMLPGCASYCPLSIPVLKALPKSLVKLNLSGGTALPLDSSALGQLITVCPLLKYLEINVTDVIDVNSLNGLLDRGGQNFLQSLTLYLFKKQKWEPSYNCHLHIDNVSKINFSQLKNFAFCCEHESLDQEVENVTGSFLSMIFESASEADYLEDMKIQHPVSSQNFGLWPIKSDWMKKILERVHTLHLWNFELPEHLFSLKTNRLRELSINGCGPLSLEQIQALVITQSKSLGRLEVLNLRPPIVNLVSWVCASLDRARPEQLLPSSKLPKNGPF
uniref:F-box domain-containing protein n=1 Tax=Ditylenchus dipsaci TaxID=166011 RepID=A0A915DM20_9BILA